MFASRPLMSSLIAFTSLATLGAGCSSDDSDTPALEVHDPATAEKVAVDRFSADAATLMVRTDENGLPGPNEAIDFDQGPFITRGLGPNGERVRYYNFDIQPTGGAPIYAFFYESSGEAVAGQLNVVDVIPGVDGYSDFWQVNKVFVPDDYKANSAVSLDDILDAGFAMETTDLLVNCPVVPEGSTAMMRGGGESAGLHQGWYQGSIVHYFTFEEAPLKTAAGGLVPLSPIYVTFNENPSDSATSGPASGFVTEEDGEQTHNVLGALPGDSGYSPLWSVNVYDNADFDAVTDLSSVEGSDPVNVLAMDQGTVNCPVVEIIEE